MIHRMASVKAGVLRDILIESLSDGHVAVLDKLASPKYDEDVAVDLELKATVVRTLLNDLHENGLVGYQRTKNKKTGWYTYLWVRRDEKVSQYGLKYLDTRLKSLSNQLDDETQTVTFQCDCMRVPYEAAIEANFRCPICSGHFSECDNSGVVDDIVGEVSRLNSLMSMIT